MNNPTTTSPPDPTSSSRTVHLARRRVWLPLLAVVLVAAGAATYALTSSSTGGPTGDSPGMEVRAAAVMPFDVAATTHAFTETPDGGIEQITANNSNDTANTTAIREHLAKEAAAFAGGDYSDPAEIHGADMPGLTELEAGAYRIQVTYTEVPAGAQITLHSTDPAMVNAIHAWFMAQNSDHSMPGMGMGN